MVALLLALVLFAKLRKLRGAQTVVLGTSGERDLVTHAEGIEIAFVELRELVESTFEQVQSRLESDEARIARGISRTAVIRYDAYNEMSGRQSSSMALLDEKGTGVVLSSILHRDQARLYVKGVRDGTPEVELSPEEDEAVRTRARSPDRRQSSGGFPAGGLRPGRIRVAAQVRVAFLGPEGTFSEEALMASLDQSQRASLEPVPLPTIYDCVTAVEDGTAERAMVPIENSVEGSVNATLDALVFETDEVRIVGEVVHPVRHCLIARRRIPLEQVTRVVSHPQASGQCARFLRERMSGAEVVSAASTADAVRIVADSDEPWAALGTRLAAELYGCVVLEDGVEDLEGNETRFVWLAQEARPSGGKPPDGVDGGRRPSRRRSPSGASRTRPGHWSVCSRSSPVAR